MKCINCNSGKEPVFRTNPLGEIIAGWMCKKCIVILHDVSVIDKEVEEIVNLIKEKK